MKKLLPRLAVLLMPLALACCGDPEPQPVMPVVPVVDLKPLGDALRFMSVAIVLAGIIAGVCGIWKGSHPDR